MAKTIVATKSGSSVGPYSNRFNVEIRLGYEGTTSTGYNMYVRYLVNTTANPTGSTFTSNLYCSWTSTRYSLGGGTGYQVDSGWISLGVKDYGSTVSQSANCYYTGSSDTYKSEATASYTIPYPEYTISYDENGGSGAPESQTKIHGTTLKLSTTVPTRLGYTFVGWGTSKTATSATYYAGGNYTSNSSTTLYAVWKLNTYSISYNANGGTGAPAAQTKSYGIDIILSNTIPTRKGYKFLGWGTDETAVDVTYLPGAVYSNNAAIALYAIWKKINNMALNSDGQIKKGKPWLNGKSGTPWININGIWKKGE